MGELAMYVVIRRDLHMRRGKEIAQGIHAMARLGYAKGLPLIVLQADDREHLDRLCVEAHVNYTAYAVTEDAGRTEVEPGTITAAAIGPVAKGLLPLLSAAKLY